MAVFPVFIVWLKLRLVPLLTPPTPSPLPAVVVTTCLNSRTWESSSGLGRRGRGGVACHFAVPASVSQSVFAPWESSEPCVHARVNTSTTPPISIALARRGGDVHPQQHLEELPRDAQLLSGASAKQLLSRGCNISRGC